MDIGTKIKELRTKRGLSQEQLAEQLCVSRQAVTKWETGVGMPDVENLVAISRLFGISADELLLNAGSEEAGEKHPCFESATSVDIAEPLRLDIHAGCARTIRFACIDSEKVTVALQSETITDLDRAFKVYLDPQGRNFDIDIKNTGVVADSIARSELDIVIEAPVAYADSVEIEMNADECTIADASMDIELAGYLKRLHLNRVAGHLEIDTAGDLETIATGVTGRLDINQIGATSIVRITDGTPFAAATRGKLGRRTLCYTCNGEPVQTPHENAQDAPLSIELAGSRVELTIDTVSVEG
ncbi:MAG: helix-turn-helix transcriptional regulator [Eggerthellaceae bacterium]|nr:helix-turn-helix transcriptional regulator [Eggerthellaceae bacterium]